MTSIHCNVRDGLRMARNKRYAMRGWLRFDGLKIRGLHVWLDAASEEELNPVESLHTEAESKVRVW